MSMVEGEKIVITANEGGPAFSINDPVWVTIYSGLGRIRKSANHPGVIRKVHTLKHGYTYDVAYTIESSGKSGYAREVTGERISVR